MKYKKIAMTCGIVSLDIESGDQFQHERGEAQRAEAFLKTLNLWKP